MGARIFSMTLVFMNFCTRFSNIGVTLFLCIEGWKQMYTQRKQRELMSSPCLIIYVLVGFVYIAWRYIEVLIQAFLIKLLLPT